MKRKIPTSKALFFFYKVCLMKKNQMISISLFYTPTQKRDDLETHKIKNKFFCGSFNINR